METMYYIYHIKGVKIGCSVEPQKRVNKQGYTEYDILEIHTDIDIASTREVELRKQYGYIENTCLYKDSVKNRRKWTKDDQRKGGLTNVKSGHLKNIASLGGKNNGVSTRNTTPFICVHCNKTIIGVANYKRFHNDNCKYKS